MNITAKIICDSINESGDRLTTFELEYPRFILSELNTHRVLSKNSASSRAIPMKAMHEQLVTNPAMPVHWGLNQSGMQADEELPALLKTSANAVWVAARDSAVAHAKVLAEIGLHKQVVNRITEPFMMMKTVLTGTEFNNLFWLRDHDDAQPEFHELARAMRAAYEASIPNLLYEGEWHLPYVNNRRFGEHGEIAYYVGDEEVSERDAIAISSSCCAQVSYRKSDDSLEKARMIYDRLINGQIVHASPFEHQGTPIPTNAILGELEGLTHVRYDGTKWSGNFKGWIQHRQLIPNNTAW